MSWSRTIPGTDIDRYEFLRILQAVLQERVNYGIVRDDMFCHIAKQGVLTVAQLSYLYDCNRQSIYSKLLRRHIDLPKHAKGGMVDMEYLDYMVLAVKSKLLSEEVADYVLLSLTEAGSYSVIRHLTGIDLKDVI